jgi:8-oxo-dGTP pyrophosphatase MutT (NUDIX family)
VNDRTLGAGPFSGSVQKPSRPKRSASLILIDRAGAELRILMGRRSAAQKFMPDKYVFPGGRTDPGDHRLKASADLRGDDLGRLLRSLGKKATHAKARAIAMSAIRETHEETGLPLRADLSLFRLIARAVTPPIYPHRYDTHFFAAFCDATMPEGSPGPAASEEMLEPGWFSFNAAKALDLPDITRVILEEAEARLNADPALGADLPIPFYAMHRGTMIRKSY